MSYPVGQSQVNRRADVQLVQAHINELIVHLGLQDLRKGKPGPLGLEYPPLKQLEEDGWWGPETAAAVHSYQSSASFRHGCARDGRVDPAYPLLDQLKGDPTGYGYMSAYFNIQKRTIFLLNADHLKFKGRMMDETEFPQILRADLKGK
ncbi:MAG TPA: hypothetical protein VGH38_18345 [Bryobacteraceae bacterium]